MLTINATLYEIENKKTSNDQNFQPIPATGLTYCRSRALAAYEDHRYSSEFDRAGKGTYAEGSRK